MTFVDVHIAYIIIVFTFACVFLLVYGLIQHYNLRVAVKQRTQEHFYGDPTSDVTGFDVASLLKLFSRKRDVAQTDKLATIRKSLASLTDGKADTLQNELIRAGFFNKDAAMVYHVFTLISAIALPGIFYAVSSLYELKFSFGMQLMLYLCMMLLGFIIPKLYLGSCQKKLQQECWNGFPDFMDLMVIAAESGVTPRSAIDRISQELSHIYPYLGANLHYVSLELRAGKPLHEAIENFARRVGIKEILSLGSLLEQSETLGTSLTNALRVYSDEMRDKRVAAAEEKAYALPVKLTIPLAIYVFPVTLIVILLPIMIRLGGVMQ